MTHLEPLALVISHYEGKAKEIIINSSRKTDSILEMKNLIPLTLCFR